ncbi:uncharacterized protein yc1106_07924 [Curvularia clavata]|uniref:Uncharacterized protein n=1 Tax=Curvularia clavata TaxID=95742 RepID=A0A9Q9DW63_CURCL|nr:uncharacterized protein yc1106_07924 [Curvularia clavata]
MTSSDYKSKNLSSAPKLVTPTDLFLFHVHLDSTPNQHTRTMAPQSHRTSRSETPNRHCYDISASARRNQEQDDIAQPSAQRPTSYRFSSCSTPSRSPPISSSDLNKPLPPSPTSSEKKSRKSTALRGFLRREPSRQPDSAFLRPEPYQPNQQHSAGLAVDTHSPYIHAHSYSMPSSPHPFNQSPSKSTEQLPRSQSPASDFSGTLQHQPYSISSQHQPSPHQWRPVSSVPRIETTPRSRTYPDTTLSPTQRESAIGRPRPHTTCFSPSEPFTDMSQFHLFAEAMTGLPSDSECLSPNGPPQLQGSLFARRSANDSIPLPLQHPQSSSDIPPMRPPQREQRDDWQNFEPPPLISTWATPALHHPVPLPGPPLEPYSQWQPPPQMDGITAELELLGLNDPSRQDDELPNYQQSQAEMAEIKRLEAAARARELEARWRSTRRR